MKNTVESQDKLSPEASSKKNLKDKTVEAWEMSAYDALRVNYVTGGHYFGK